MKINFACGRHVEDGFFNIDAVRSELAARDPELLFELKFADGNLVEKIPLEDECAEELHAYHIIEHFYRFDVDAVVAEWHRLLKPGGLLVLELPNLEAACRNLIQKGMSDSDVIFPIYGDPSWKSPYMCHRFGYTPPMIVQLLTDHKFKKIKQLAPQTHKRRLHRDMRIEALK